MTGPSGNRLSICPLRFRIASPRVPIDLGCASVNRNSWGGDPESLGASHYLFNIYSNDLYLGCHFVLLWTVGHMDFCTKIHFIVLTTVCYGTSKLDSAKMKINYIMEISYGNYRT